MHPLYSIADSRFCVHRHRVAASDGNLERVQQLIAEGVSVNAADEQGYTPM
jgi:hypothetical protein